MQTKKKAAFVDHSFHKKTLCTVFLKELLSKTFELDEYYDESWIGGNEIDIDKLNNYEYIFYFQFIHKAHRLKNISRKAKIVWFPMYDGVLGMKNSEWLKYQITPIKIVCFSKNLYDKLTNFGFDCAYFQYFIDPQTIQPVNDYDVERVYFWNRVEEINWDVVKKLLGNNQIKSFTFMAVPDPNHNTQIPPEKDLQKYNIQLNNQFLDYEDYIDLVSKSNIYVAPRKFEGIGMSFLEALCRGQCVIAPNFPTMNEYIVHGENGYLYELDKLEEIDLNNFEIVGKEARSRAIDGFKKWQQQKGKLIEYVSDFNNIDRKSKIVLYNKIIFLTIKEYTFLIILKMMRTFLESLNSINNSIRDLYGGNK